MSETHFYDIPSLFKGILVIILS